MENLPRTLLRSRPTTICRQRRLANQLSSTTNFINAIHRMRNITRPAGRLTRTQIHTIRIRVKPRNRLLYPEKIPLKVPITRIIETRDSGISTPPRRHTLLQHLLAGKSNIELIRPKIILPQSRRLPHLPSPLTRLRNHIPNQAPTLALTQMPDRIHHHIANRPSRRRHDL
ncbi:hypothetical protein, partial [Amycolatopsis pretoriensis]|uniref:hypothetical protein n=1 Tax=Amycolatopsis pretoriensis TaxID=218821 RepID=UPI001B80C4A2